MSLYIPDETIEYVTAEKILENKLVTNQNFNIF